MVRISLGQRGFRAPDGAGDGSRSAGDAAVRPNWTGHGNFLSKLCCANWVGQRTRSCRWRWGRVRHRRPGGVLQRVNPAKAFEAAGNSPETVAGTCLHDANEFRSDIRLSTIGANDVAARHVWAGSDRHLAVRSGRQDEPIKKPACRPCDPFRSGLARKPSGRAFGCMANAWPSSQNVRDSSHDCVLISTCGVCEEKACLTCMNIFRDAS